MVEILTMQQRSAEWYQARLGLVTASNFAEVMAKGRGSAPSARRQTYLNHVVAERLSRELSENYTGADAERGIALEDEAIAAYEFQTDATVKRIGMVRNDIAGASPDGLVGDDGLVEVKAPRRHHYIRMILSEDPAADYRPQIMGQLWLSERARCDLVLYSPPLPLFVHRVVRDADYIDDLAAAVAAFEADVIEACTDARRIIHTNERLDPIEEMAGANPWRDES